MIRSLYSGVAGLKTQQTKMDVIGNNIANVGTYGFKSDRATFKDVYYQTTSTASASTGNVGGTNAKQIGYGNLVGSIDTNTKTSAMSSTGYGLDIAIAGEGFLQVMGPDGNIMYTKAGMLDIDAEGNLVDVNGNFVLGVSGSDMTLEPGSNKIQVTLPFLDAQNSKVESTINNVDYTITSSNSTDKANVNFNFVSSSSLPIGQKMIAKISGDSITVTVNANEEFESAAEINKELNKAIKAANGNVEHPAGEFSLTMVPEQTKFTALDVDTTKSASIKLKGSELVSSDFGYIPGELNMDDGLRNLFSIKSTGENFKGDTRDTKFDFKPNNTGFTAAFTARVAGTPANPTANPPVAGTPDTPASLTVSVTDTDGNAHNGIIGENEIRRLSGVAADAAITNVTLDGNATNGYALHVTTAAGTTDIKMTEAQLKEMANNKPQDYQVKYDASGVTITIKNADGSRYEGKISPDQLKSANDLLMVRTLADDSVPDSTDSFVISVPSLATMKSTFEELATKNADASYQETKVNGEVNTFTLDFKNAIKMIQSEPSRSLGLGQTAFKLTGGTEGGEQTVANLTSISINEGGHVVGVHDIYGIVDLGRIDLATFANPAGLQKVGNSYFTTSLNSGDPVIVEAGTEGTGQIMASTLEASNVDLSNEFSDMIMTQRGFQASSRVITVSDTMLEELINLKR